MGSPPRCARQPMLRNAIFIQSFAMVQSAQPLNESCPLRARFSGFQRYRAQPRPHVSRAQRNRPCEKPRARLCPENRWVMSPDRPVRSNSAPMPNRILFGLGIPKDLATLPCIPSAPMTRRDCMVRLLPPSMNAVSTPPDFRENDTALQPGLSSAPRDDASAIVPCRKPSGRWPAPAAHPPVLSGAARMGIQVCPLKPVLDAVSVRGDFKDPRRHYPAHWTGLPNAGCSSRRGRVTGIGNYPAVLHPAGPLRRPPRRNLPSSLHAGPGILFCRGNI